MLLQNLIASVRMMQLQFMKPLQFMKAPQFMKPVRAKAKTLKEKQEKAAPKAKSKAARKHWRRKHAQYRRAYPI